MQPSLAVWVRRLGFLLWGAATLVLGFQVLNLATLLDDMDTGYRESEQSNQILRGLVVSLAKSASKKDVLVLVRRLAPSEIIVENDSSVALNGLTFRFDHNGVVDTVLSEYDP